MEGGAGPSDSAAPRGCAIAVGAIVNASHHDSYLNVNSPEWLMEGEPPTLR